MHSMWYGYFIKLVSVIKGIGAYVLDDNIKCISLGGLWPKSLGNSGMGNLVGFCYRVIK